MELIDRYLQYVQAVRRYSPRTVDIYGEVLREYAEYSCAPEDGISDEALSKALTPAALRNYIVHLLDEKGESPRTVNLHVSVLSGFCRYLMKEKLLDANPVRLISRPKTEKRLPEFYREESMKDYFERTAFYAGKDSFEMLLSCLASGSKGDLEEARRLYRRRLARLIVAMLYSTGMRRSELISLDRGSLDSSRGVLHVKGKGDKMREIPVISSLSEEISLYLQTVESMVGCAATAQDPLLRTEKGGRLYPVYVDRAVKEELGGGDITGRKSPHVLRHTLATELLDEGTDLNSIKELLGHSSLAATQVYTHNSIEKLKKVYNNAHPRAKIGANYEDKD